MEPSNRRPSGRIQRQAAPDAVSQLPILGRVKCGVKVRSSGGKMIPSSVDYFVATGKYARLFDEAHGDKPSVLPIVFPSDDPRYVCDERFECRSKEGRLVATGDGEVFRIWRGDAYHLMTGEEAKAELGDLRALGVWSTILTLRFILLRVKSVLGVWQFSTKGEKSSIPAIRETFDRVQEYCGGSLVNVPFDLTVEFATSQRPGAASRFPVVNLVPNVGQEEMFLLAEMAERGEKMRGLVTPDRLVEPKQLPPPDPQVEEVDDIQDESDLWVDPDVD